MSRVGEDFIDLTKSLSEGATFELGKKVSQTRMSDYISRVVREEGIDAVILRRIRSRRGLK